MSGEAHALLNRVNLRLSVTERWTRLEKAFHRFRRQGEGMSAVFVSLVEGCLSMAKENDGRTRADNGGRMGEELATVDR